MKRFITILLAMIITLTAAVFTACSCNPEQGEVNKMTNYDLIKNGNTEYTIIVPKNPDTDIVMAASEIILFFNKAAGCDIGLKYDEEFQHFDKKINENSKYIVLGDTSIDEKAFGIDKSALPAQGYVVKNVNSNVFIVGADSLGVLYGAYEFLKQTIEFEAYGVDEYHYIETKNLKLCELNVTDAPDFKFRYPNYGPLRNEYVANRLRINRERDVWIRDKGNFIHNSQEEFLPSEEYYAEHKDWYSDVMHKDGTRPAQLCYTAHGNPAQVKEMQDKVVDRMIELIDTFYSQGEYRGSISFTQEDGVTWCECDGCTAMKDKYGTNAAAVIHFLNPIADRISQYMNDNWNGRSLDIVFFAYSKTEDAPVKLVDGEYKAIDDTVICRDNLAVFYAPIYASYTYDFNHSVNSKYLETMKKWQVLSKKLYLWTYSDTFADYMCPYDTFSSMQSIYRTAKENNSVLFFDQSRFDVNSLTGFDHLKIYLNSKLAWNVDEDYQTLIDNWFENYFKAAATPMRKIFDGYRSWMKHLMDTTDVALTTGVPYMRAEDWPKQLLCQWEGNINEAYASIEYLKQIDEGLYEKLYDRICLESIWIRFQLIDMHANKMTDAESLERKLSFKKDADRLGFTVWKENDFSSSDITTKYAEWGI